MSFFPFSFYQPITGNACVCVCVHARACLCACACARACDEMSIYPYAFESSTGSYKTSTINNILLLLVPCAKMSTTAMQFIGNPSPPDTAGICIKYPGHDAKSAGGWLQYSKTHMRQDSSSFRRHQPCNNQNSVVRTLHHSG